MSEDTHEKRHLPRALELERRRYIGFGRTPVIDTDRVFVTDAKISTDRPSDRPWVDCQTKRKESE